MSQHQPTTPRQLRRSRTDRYVGGVCGGLARYLNMDPTLVRILTVVVTLFTVAPAVLYVVTLFLMPEEDVAPAVPTGRGEDAVWGAGGPPWAPAAGAEPQDPATSAASFSGTMSSPAAGQPADPPRPERDAS